MRVNSRKAGVGTVFWKHQLHEKCGEQLTTTIVVVGAPDMRSGGTGEWILACGRRKQEGEEKKKILGGQRVSRRRRTIGRLIMGKKGTHGFFSTTHS